MPMPTPIVVLPEKLVNDLEGACLDWRKAADFGLKNLLNG